MAKHAGSAARSGGGADKRGGSRSGGRASEGSDGGVLGMLPLPANLDRSLRHLHDEDLDRLLEAAAAKARRHGLQGRSPWSILVAALLILSALSAFAALALAGQRVALW